MIPFTHVEPIHLGPISVHVFGIAVVLAVILGMAIARRRFLRFGFDPALGERMAMWILIGGFLGAHLFAVLLYFPEAVARDPWILLRIWEHISSFGAMIGGVAGAVLFLWLRASSLTPVQRWGYVDAVAFAFPISLAVGRAGCALIHDHPGRITDFVGAVSLKTETGRNFITSVYVATGQADALPGQPDLPDLGFHDLGMYEMIYLAIFVVPTMFRLDRKPRPSGFFVVAFLALYLPVRFGFDFLRVSDATYAGLTPAQWVAVIVIALLPLVWSRIPKRNRTMSR